MYQIKSRFGLIQLIGRRVLSSTSYPTDDLNLIYVDPNQSLVRLMKRSTFGLGHILLPNKSDVPGGSVWLPQKGLYSSLGIYMQMPSQACRAIFTQFFLASAYFLVKKYVEQS